MGRSGALMGVQWGVILSSNVGMEKLEVLTAVCAGMVVILLGAQMGPLLWCRLAHVSLVLLPNEARGDKDHRWGRGVGLLKLSVPRGKQYRRSGRDWKECKRVGIG